MTRLYALACIILSSCIPTPTQDTSGANEFEGVITYQARLIAKSDLIDEDQLNQLYGDTLRWSYRNGSYRWQYNGTGVQDVYYQAGSNTEYTKRSGIDTLFAVNVREEARTLDAITLIDTIQTVLDTPCTVLMMQMAMTQHTYCISRDHHLQANRFEFFAHGFLGRRLEVAPGAHLDFRYESPIFIIERTAISIEQRTLSDEMFTPPPLPVTGLTP